MTWRNEGYVPPDEEREVVRGRFHPARPRQPMLYDPGAELTRRFENADRRGHDPVHYVRGKIVFGAFSRLLIDRIRLQAGRLFHPLAPDYTSMVPAGIPGTKPQSTSGRPLLLSYNSVNSNGRRHALDPSMRGDSSRPPTPR